MVRGVLCMYPLWSNIPGISLFLKQNSVYVNLKQNEMLIIIATVCICDIYKCALNLRRNCGHFLCHISDYNDYCTIVTVGNIGGSIRWFLLFPFTFRFILLVTY